MTPQISMTPVSLFGCDVNLTDSNAMSDSAGAAAINAKQIRPTPLLIWERQLRVVGYATPLILAIISAAVGHFMTASSWFVSWPGMLVMTFAVTAASTDTLWRKIPNWLTYPACLTGLVIGCIVTIWGPSNWAGGMGLGSAFQGLVVCFACMLLPYRASGGGAGDVKIAAAYGSLLGWQAGLSIVVIAYMAAGLVLMLMHLCSSHPWLLPSALMRWFGSAWLPRVVAAPDESQKKLLARPVPLAGAFLVGLICVLCGANLFGT